MTNRKFGLISGPEKEETWGLTGPDTKKTDDLLKLKYHNVDVGIATYDHHIRYTGMGSSDLVNAKMIYFLSKALMIDYPNNASVKKEITGDLFTLSSLTNSRLD